MAAVRPASRTPSPTLETAPSLDIAAVPSTPLALRFEPEPAAATATIETPKPSAIRRAVGAIPGLGFLKRKSKQSREDYVPARALRQVHPVPPAILPEHVPVRVKLLISETGNVTGTELVSKRVDAELAKLALDAARRWKFEPARLNEKPVDAEVVVQFRF